MNAPRSLTSAAVGRTLPHSLEAEEYLLSCCMLDVAEAETRAEIIRRARAEGISHQSFYDTKHGVVFDCLCHLLDTGKPTVIAAVAEELKTTRQLDQIGGYAFLTQVASRIPTTAQSSYFIEKVREQALLREIIRSATGTVEDCYNFTAGIDEFASEVRAKIASATTRHSNAGPRKYEMIWDDLINFDGRTDADCLMGKRYLGRTCGLVIVAPSGLGKSVLSAGLSCCAALGWSFFGMLIVQPLRVLYVQAEDDLGDVAEAVQGFLRENPLSPDQLAQLKKNLRIVRWNDAAGERFLTRLRAEHAKHPFDLVLINPLFSFCGCNVSDQAEMSRFLRNGLNPILNDTRAAAVIVHHTNKPPTDGKDRPDANADLRYSGSGSSELTNWARAYVTLQPIKGAPEGVCKMVFAKRGTRAGIVDENGHPTTSVLIEHSKRGLCWIPSDYTVEKGDGGKFAPKFDLARAVQVYDPALDWQANQQAIALDQNVAIRTVRRWRQSIADTAA
jgi:hypothetical protein